MKKVLLLLLSIALFIGCKKENTDVDKDQLSDEELAFWESLGVDTTASNKVVFEDGTSVEAWLKIHDSAYLSRFVKTTKTTNYDFLQNELKAFVASETYAARYLTVDANFEEYGQPNGLAYIYASADYTVGKQNCGGVNLHGLDCSGYVYTIFHDLMGIKDLQRYGTNDFANPDNWNKALATSSQYKGIVAVLYKNVAASQLKPGDILVKPGSHMGIIVQMENGGLKFANSLGKRKNSCQKNSSAEYGPILSPTNDKDLLSKVLNSDYIKGYVVIRFENHNVCYAGHTDKGDLINFNLDGNPPYNGSIQLNNVDFAVEATPSLSKVIQYGINFTSTSPDIPNFQTIPSNVPISAENTTITNNNNHITIHLNDLFSYEGDLSGNQISGTLKVNATYTDFPTNKVTQTPLTCKMDLNKQ